MPAKNLDNLPKDVVIECRTFPNNNDVWIEAVDANGNQYSLEGEDRILFGLKAEMLKDPLSGKEVWRVVNTEAIQGWGPFVYDLAMEIASSDNRGGLVTGTGLTADSRGVWEFYRDKRNDVTKTGVVQDHPWLKKGSLDLDFPFYWTKAFDILPSVEAAGIFQRKIGGIEIEPDITGDDEIYQQLNDLFDVDDQNQES